MTSLPKKNNSGQALLIVVLVMAVALTVGLAVISRSVTDVRITQQSEESARVFSVAEAGIEEALKTGLMAGGTAEVDIGEINAKVKKIGDTNKEGGGPEFAFSKNFSAGEIQTFWLLGHNTADGSLDTTGAGSYSGNNIEVYWGNIGSYNQGCSCTTNCPPALEVTLVYSDSGGFKIAKYPLDPDTNRASPSCNNFTLAETGSYEIGGSKFEFKKVIPEPLTIFPTGTKYALRLRLLYNDSPQGIGIKAAAGATLPKQGDCYESTAKDDKSQITRTVQQCRFYKAPPAIFDYVLYSEGDLVK